MTIEMGRAKNALRSGENKIHWSRLENRDRFTS